MSKASEYAARVKAAREAPPSFMAKGSDTGNLEWFGAVASTGDLSLRGCLAASEVPAFITWLQDTFGEPTKGGEAP